MAMVTGLLACLLKSTELCSHNKATSLVCVMAMVTLRSGRRLPLLSPSSQYRHMAKTLQTSFSRAEALHCWQQLVTLPTAETWLFGTPCCPKGRLASLLSIVITLVPPA